MFQRIKNYLTYIVLCIFPVMHIFKIGEGMRFNISLADLLIPLLGLVWLIDIKNFSFKKNFPFAWYFLALLAAIFLSGILNMNSGVVSSGYKGMLSEALKIVISGIYTFVAYNSIDRENKDIKKLQIMMIFGLIGLYICMAYGLYATMSTLLKIDYIKIIATSDHRRFIGVQTDPNAAALYLSACFFIIVLASNYIYKNLPMRIFLFVTNILVLICILLTMSRGGMVGFGAGVLFLVVLNIKKYAKKIVYIIPIVVVMVFALSQADERYLSGYFKNNISGRAKNALSDNGSLETRLNLSKASINVGLDHPMLGIGRGNFPLNSKEYFIDLGVDWDKTGRMYKDLISHNTLAGFFAELGIIGVGVFVSLFLLMLYKVFKSDKHDFYFKTIIFSLWGSILVQSLSISLENARVIWILAGLLL